MEKAFRLIGRSCRALVQVRREVSVVPADASFAPGKVFSGVLVQRVSLDVKMRELFRERYHGNQGCPFSG